VLRPEDANPERLIVESGLVSTPSANVADHFAGALTGVMDYSFGNFKLLVTSLPTPVSGGLTREKTSPAKVGEVAIATFDLGNLDATDQMKQAAQNLNSLGIHLNEMTAE
jgi:hypothetical protein